MSSVLAPGSLVLAAVLVIGCQSTGATGVCLMSAANNIDNSSGKGGVSGGGGGLRDLHKIVCDVETAVTVSLVDTSHRCCNAVQACSLPPHASVPPDKVHTFVDAAELSRLPGGYVPVAHISAQGYGSQQAALDAIRRAAALVGANGVLFPNLTDPSTRTQTKEPKTTADAAFRTSALAFRYGGCLHADTTRDGRVDGPR